MNTSASLPTVDIGIDGMTCASCVARVERALRKVDGVQDASVNLATESARVTLAPELADTAAGQAPATLLRAIRNAGYTPRANSGLQPLDDSRIFGVPRDFAPVLAGLLLCLPLVAPMFLAPFIGSDEAHSLVPVWLQFILGTIVQFTLGLRFYRGAWHALKQRTGNMELLVAIGTTAAWGLSLWLWWRHGLSTDARHAAAHGAPHVYFESAAVVITLVQLGKWLEMRARRQTSQAIAALQALRPDVAHWLSPFDGEQDVPVSELLVGDRVMLRPGERVPADAQVVEGRSQIDASMLTGEPLPVEVGPGDKVTGGTLNGGGLLQLQVSATAGEGVLAHIIRLVEDAQAAKPPIQKLVDKVAAVFVPAVLVVAALTLVAWLLAGLPTEQAILRAVAVLVIACPCALGLATPVAIMAGTGVAAKHGILIKDSVALERAHEVQVVAFDKTGTLTQGQPVLAALQPLQAGSALMTGEGDGGVPGSVAPAAAQGAAMAPLAAATALQQGSEHPLALAVLRAFAEQTTVTPDEPAAPAIPTAQDVQAIAGHGIQGQLEDGATWYLGSLRWMEQLQPEAVGTDAGETFMKHWLAQGATLSALARQQPGGPVQLQALLAFTDTPKPEAAEAVGKLHAQGLQTVLISGDNRAAAEALARRVGLKPEQGEVQAEVLPADKANAIRELQQGSSGEPRVVAMVGDGINDAPALAAADVGMAMANPQGGTDVALHAADVTLMRGDVRLVAGAIAISRATVRKIRQNLFWAFAYNVIGIPLAAFGMLSPMLAGAAMALSSVSVVSNALLLRRWKP